MYEPLFCECCGQSIAELRKEIEENGVSVVSGSKQRLGTVSVTGIRSGRSPNFGRSFSTRQRSQEFLSSWSIPPIRVSSVRYVGIRTKRTGRHEIRSPVCPVTTPNLRTLTRQKILRVGLPPTSLW